MRNFTSISLDYFVVTQIIMYIYIYNNRITCNLDAFTKFIILNSQHTCGQIRVKHESHHEKPVVECRN